MDDVAIYWSLLTKLLIVLPNSLAYGCVFFLKKARCVKI